MPSAALLLSVLVSAQAALPLNEPMDRALAFQIPPAGLQAAGDAVAAMVPTHITISDVQDEVYCADTDLNPLYYELDDLTVLLSADQVLLETSEGRIDIHLYGTLGSTESQFYFAGDCSVLTDLDEVCAVRIPTTALHGHIGVAVDEVDGTFVVTTDELSFSISPVTNPLSDCTLASVVGTLLGQDPEAISNLLLSYLSPALWELAPTIEEALEGLLNGLVVDMDLELGQYPLGISLYPTLFELGDAGLLLGLGGLLTADGVSDCVEDIGGSQFNDDLWPDFSGLVPGTSVPFDLGLMLGRDFTDHLLYGLWSVGALCMDIDELGGAPLSTSLLEPFFGEAFAELFPGGVHATLLLRPEAPPLSVFSADEPPLAVDLEDLGLSMRAPLDGRIVNVFRVGVDGQVGVSVDLSADAVAPVLILDPATFTFRETMNELLPEGFSDQLPALLDMVLGSFLPDDLLEPFSLPDLMGVDFAAVFWAPTGDQSWQGLYTLLDTSGVEPVELAGCQGGGLGCDGGGSGPALELGCDDGEGAGCSEGCDEGATCSTGRISISGLATWRALLLGALVFVVGGRRRERGSLSQR